MTGGGNLKAKQIDGSLLEEEEEEEEESNSWEAREIDEDNGKDSDSRTDGESDASSSDACSKAT